MQVFSAAFGAYPFASGVAVLERKEQTSLDPLAGENLCHIAKLNHWTFLVVITQYDENSIYS